MHKHRIDDAPPLGRLCRSPRAAIRPRHSYSETSVKTSIRRSFSTAMNARQVPSEAQPLLGRKTERRAFATTRSTLGVVAAAACGVVGLAALQRGGHAVPFLGAKRASPDAALRTQAETIRAAYYEGAAVSGDLQVRPFVRYGETGNLGSTGYEKCVGPDAKPVDGYHKTDAEAVRADCLLYTSPSPRDATLSRMPSSA